MNKYSLSLIACLTWSVFSHAEAATTTTTTALPQHAPTTTQSLDRIVAVVNKSVITQSELDDEINKVKKQLAMSHTDKMPPLPPEDILRKEVLDQLIDKTLLLYLVKSAGIHVTDADVTKAIDLVAKNNHLTPDALYAEVKKQGLTRDEYRDEIQKEIAIGRLEQQAVGGRVTLTPQEVDDFIQANDKQLDPQHKKEQAQQILYSKKYEAALKEWMTALRGQAFINTHQDND